MMALRFDGPLMLDSLVMMLEGPLMHSPAECHYVICP
jgi:hypothetical protein